MGYEIATLKDSWDDSVDTGISAGERVRWMFLMGRQQVQAKDTETCGILDWRRTSQPPTAQKKQELGKKERKRVKNHTKNRNNISAYKWK